MIELTYDKECEPSALYWELARAVPGLAPIPQPDGSQLLAFNLSYWSGKIFLQVPDDVPVADVQKVISDHDPVQAWKAKRIGEVKREAHSLLRGTDWYVVRHQETGAPIPQAVLDYRAAVRAACDQAEKEIAQLDSVEAARAYSVQWPEGV